MHKRLTGLNILVTRPLGQGEMLCQAIENAGGAATHFPSIEIQSVVLDALPRNQIDWLIFISPNAVDYGVAAYEGKLPKAAKIAAIGRATAKRLQQAGYPVDLVPEGKADSESFLALPAMQKVEGKRFVIVRGEGGRQLLADSLQDRGAAVMHAVVYRRAIPNKDPHLLLSQWRSTPFDGVVITSGESFENLLTLLGAEGAARLKQTTLVVISQRIFEQVHAQGFEQVIVAQGASDDAVLQALEANASALLTRIDRGEKALADENKNKAPSNKAVEQKTPTKETPPPVVTTVTAKPSSSGLIVGSIAIVLVLATAGAGYFFIKQIQDQTAGVGGDLEKSSMHRMELNKQINNYQAEVNTLHQQITSLETRLANKEQQISTSNDKLERYLGDQAKLYNERLESTRGELKTDMTRIHRQLGKTRSDWLMADAEYLLSVANQRLHLVGDLKTTIIALEAADQRLRESADPAAYPIREQLADEIDSLKKIDEPDVVGMFIKIGQLQRKVPELPLLMPFNGQHVKENVDEESITGQTEKAVDSGFEELDNVLASAWKDLRGLVKVRRSDQPIDQILSPSEALALKQGLVLQLEQARTALVQRDAAIFEQSLQGVQLWLQKYFAQDDEITQRFEQNVKALQGFTPSINYPDISRSLKLLRDITKLRIETDKRLDEDEHASLLGEGDNA